MLVSVDVYLVLIRLDPYKYNSSIKIARFLTKMTLNSKNLEKLKAYGKKLSSSTPSQSVSQSKSKRVSNTLHPIETEEDPSKLFKELIKASPNGEVPPHLLKRLKEDRRKF